MAAYLLGRMAISDPSKYARYKALTPDIIARYGGRFLTRGGEKLTLEGPPTSGGSCSSSSRTRTRRRASIIRPIISTRSRCAKARPTCN